MWDGTTAPPFGSTDRLDATGRLQSLDRPVDEVGRVAHGFGRAKDDAGHHLLGCGAVSRNRKVGPHGDLVAVERLRQAMPPLPLPKLRGQMGHCSGVNCIRRGEVSEIPARLEQRGQQQAPRIGSRARVDEGQVILGQVCSVRRVPPGQPRARAWIGRAVEGGHELSRKGCATHYDSQRGMPRFAGMAI